MNCCVKETKKVEFMIVSARLISRNLLTDGVESGVLVANGIVSEVRPDYRRRCGSSFDNRNGWVERSEDFCCLPPGCKNLSGYDYCSRTRNVKNN